MSDCPRSSQSRKISIGVTTDSIAERKLGAIKEDECKQPNTERNKHKNGISAEATAVTNSKGNQAEEPEPVKSSWITPRSVHAKSFAPQTASFNLGQKNHKKTKDVAITYSVQYFSNQTFNAQNVGSKNSFDSFFDDITYKREGMNDGNSQKVEEFNFVNAGKVLESDKVVLEGKADKTQKIPTETLKMKLQELLGNVSSPKSQLSSSQPHDVNNLKPDISADHMGDTVVKPQQCSDTIETDSENPDQTFKTPVTRSLTRKRAPAKAQTDKTKVGLSSKQKYRESIFSFGEGRSTKSDAAVNNGSKLSKKNKIQKKSSKIDPRKICFTKEGNADENKQTSYRIETPTQALKTSTLGNKLKSFPGSFSEKRREDSGKVPEKLTKKTQTVNFDNPTSPQEGDKLENFGSISLKNVVYTPDNFQSSTFGFKTPILNTPPSPTPKSVEIEQGAQSPISERGFTLGNIWSFRTFQASRPVCNKSNALAYSPVSLTILQDSDVGGENIKRHEHSEPSSEERLSESSEDGSPIIKRYDCHPENLISPDTDVSEKPHFVHCPIKPRQNHEDFRFTECSPTSAFQKGARTGESVWFQEPPEQDQEDELTRAVTLFASALETFKRRIDSTTKKKSSEILVSISEEIKSLFLNAQSEIESDVGKLTSLHKTKKKCLETRLQGQQEHFKLILEKFKEDIHHYLLDCNGILEGMEAHQIELKGIVKKQKVSHQKLLMHMEKAAEIQLHNAERRIIAVRESAREKMLQLKHVIAECFKDNRC